MFFSAYGLVIQSDFFLPELALKSDNQCHPDIKIYQSKLQAPELHPTDSNILSAISQDSAYLYWSEAGTILVKEGKQIVVDPIDNFDEQILRIFVLGAAFGLLLHQRGFMILHGNSINIKGKGVCFIGNRGFGKSTISASLYFKGYPIVSDDVTAIKFENSQAYLVPGYGRIKLWTDSVEALGLEAQNLPKVHPNFEKREYLINESLVTDLVPLKCVYILGGAEELTIESLSPSEALFKIMQNCYCTRFCKQMYNTLSAVEHFQQSSSLVKHTNVFALKRTNDLSSLAKLTELIEEHIAKL
ncbi:hypothetical protein NIES4102_01090 [Chondrocystis sp. NIES-4102]|nr:hypothetical protein NIES4102_01090 [Chondrocystis sp. NIES-4102]